MIESIRSQWKECLNQFQKAECKDKSLLNELSTTAIKHSQLRVMQSYLKCSTKLQESSVKVISCFEAEQYIWEQHGGGQQRTFSNWIRKSGNAFNELIHALEMFSRIRKALMKLPGKNLHILTYANEQYSFFKSKIQEIINERLEFLLKLFHWPTPNHKLTDNIVSLQFSKEKLLSVGNNLDINEISNNKWIVEQVDSRIEPFLCLFIQGLRLQQALEPFTSTFEELWVLRPLFSPIISRFTFHFMEESDTNRIDKPEWAFSFIGNTISDHAEFFLVYIQPWINLESKTVVPDAKNLFIKQLVQLIEGKLLNDMPELLTKYQNLYCHTLNECVKLDTLLFDVHNYPRGSKSPLESFAYNEELLSSWIKIEFHGKEKRYLKNFNHQKNTYFF